MYLMEEKTSQNQGINQAKGLAYLYTNSYQSVTDSCWGECVNFLVFLVYFIQAQRYRQAGGSCQENIEMNMVRILLASATHGRAQHLSTEGCESDVSSILFPDISVIGLNDIKYQTLILEQKSGIEGSEHHQYYLQLLSAYFGQNYALVFICIITNHNNILEL